MTDERVLTIGDVIALAALADAAARCAHVRWLTSDGTLVEGTARAITREGGGFITGDVRDGYLHVSGFGEMWLPVSDLVGMIGRGEFAID